MLVNNYNLDILFIKFLNFKAVNHAKKFIFCERLAIEICLMLLIFKKHPHLLDFFQFFTKYDDN